MTTLTLSIPPCTLKERHYTKSIREKGESGLGMKRPSEIQLRNVHVRVKNGCYFFTPQNKKEKKDDDEQILIETRKVALECAELILSTSQTDEDDICTQRQVRRSSFYNQLVEGIDDPELNGNDKKVWTSFDKPIEVRG